MAGSGPRHLGSRPGKPGPTPLYRIPDMAEDGATPDPDLPEENPAAAMRPFLIAGAIVAVVVIAIVLSNFFRPVDDRLSDDSKVQFTINDVYSARNAVDYDAYRAGFCSADLAQPNFPTREEFDAENAESMEENGPIVIPEMTDLVVDGDRATVKVHWHFENSEDDKQVTDLVVVRVNDDWKVCGS